MSGKSLVARLENLNESGQIDKKTRDEKDVGAETSFDLVTDTSRYSTDRKNTTDTEENEDPDSPGDVKAILISAKSVRLVTQEYFSQELLEKRKATETRHQILPYGFLRIRTSLTDKELLKWEGGWIPLMQNGVRTLEVTKRWYIGEKPSTQPAFAGTNPRVGGPGTHRVQGLNQKLRDGSVYVHNGEFFQAAEDLHIPGKVMDLTFRRTYMLHSLFTSSLGRNWDWMGNMRLIEMLNGDVYLTNGEAGIEVYRSKTKAPPDAGQVSSIRYPNFSYASLFNQSQYKSPAGVYRCLIKGTPVDPKGKPVDMPGMPVDAEGARVPRFYLVSKHGTVWTFVKDIRFETKAGFSEKLAEKDKANKHEPPPGVRAHYHLVCIHDRRQANYIKLQRDSAGLVCGVIDDYGRVTRLKYAAGGAVADRFLTSIKDFAAREITPTHKDRNLEAVKGPRVTMEAGGKSQEPEKTQFTYRYTEKAGNGHRYRLRLVHELSAKFLAVDKWDKHGRVAKQTVLGKYHYEWDYENYPKVIHREKYKGYDLNLKKADLVDVHEFTIKPRGDSTGAESRPAKPQVAFEFDQVVSHRVGIQKGSKVTWRPPTTTTHDTQGEITQIILPKKNSEYFLYCENGSQAGNLLETGTRNVEQTRQPARQQETAKPTTGEQTVTRVKYEYAKPGEAPKEQGEANGTRWNLPKAASADAYQNDKSAIVTELGYDGQGNQVRCEFPTKSKKAPKPTSAPAADKAKVDGVAFFYRDDGLLEWSTNVRGAKTCYYYYERPEDPDPKKNHLPGDAWHRAGMLMSTQVLRAGEKGTPPPKEHKQIKDWDKGWDQIATWQRPAALKGAKDRENVLKASDGDIKRKYNYANGMITTFKPSILGNPLKTVDPDGVVVGRQFNELGQVLKEGRTVAEHGRLKDDASETCGYYAFKQWDSGQLFRRARRTTPMLGDGYHVSREFLYDQLGNLTKTSIAGIETITEHDIRGNPIEQAVKYRYSRGRISLTKFVYDERGLLWKREVTGYALKRWYESHVRKETAVAGKAGKASTRPSSQPAEDKIVITDELEYDGNGNLIFHKDPEGWCEAWRYNDADQLVLEMNGRGLVHEVAPGHGGLVKAEGLYEPEAIISLRDTHIKRLLQPGGNRSKEHQAQPTTCPSKSWAEGLKSQVQKLAQDVKDPKKNAPIRGAILAKVTYARDARGRVKKEKRAWNPGGGAVAKLVHFRTDWCLGDLPSEQWVEVGSATSATGEKVGPRAVRKYDSLGRPNSQYLLPSDFKGKPTKSQGQQVTLWSYGVHGLLQTITPDGTKIRQITDMISSSDHDILESWAWRPGAGGDVLIERQALSKMGFFRARETVLRQANDKETQSTDKDMLPMFSFTSDKEAFEKIRGLTVRWEELHYNFDGRVKRRYVRLRRGRKALPPDPFFKRGPRPEEPVEWEETYEYAYYGQLCSQTTNRETCLYKHHHLFGPRLIQQPQVGKPGLVDTVVRYDLCGNRTCWSDTDGTSFHAAYDGEGEIISLEARHPESSDGKKTKTEETKTEKTKTEKTKTKKTKTMHTRVFIRDAMGRPVCTLDDQMDYLVAVKSEKNPDSPVELKPSGKGRSVKVVNKFEYDMLGYLVSETQLSPDKPQAKRKTVYTCTATGFREKTEWPQVSEKESFVVSMEPKLDLPSKVKLTEKGGRATELVKSLEYGKDLLPDKCNLASPHKTAGYETALEDNGCKVRLSQKDLLKHTTYERLHHRKYPVSDDTEREDTTKTIGIAFEAVKKRPVSKRHVDRSTEKYLSSFGFAYERRAYTKVSQIKGEKTDAVSENWSYAREYPDRNGPPEKKSRDAESLALHQKLGGGFGVSNDYALDRLTRTKVTTWHTRRSKTDRGKPSATLGTERAGGVWPLAVDRSGRTWGEPGATISRNAFGEPVVIADPNAPDQVCFLRYDALGRLVAKDLPAKIVVPPVPSTDAHVIDVGAEKTIPGHVQKETLKDAVAFIISYVKGEQIPRLPPFLKLLRLFCEMAGHSRKWLIGAGKSWAVRIHRSAAGDIGVGEALGMLRDAENAARAHYKETYPGSDTRNWRLFGSITIESATNDFIEVRERKGWEGGLPLIKQQVYIREGMHDISLRRLWMKTSDGKPQNIVLGNTSNIAIDGCRLAMVKSFKSSPRLQIQNCVFEKSDHAVFCVMIFNAENSSVLIAHNLFCDKGSYPPVAISTWARKRTLVAVINNFYVGTMVCVKKSPMGGEDIFVACNHVLDRNWEDAVNGKGKRLLGAGDLPAAVSRHCPVLWDRRGCLRDPKTPTIGPVEIVPHNQRDVHRYVYDGARVAQRETYRTKAGEDGASKELVPSGSEAKVTRFINPFPGGPTFFADSDDTIDVNVTDRYGLPWYMYRLRDGKDAAGAGKDCRNSGLLRPTPYPTWSFIDYDPWFVRMLERDVRMGRRGVLGWDSRDRDIGVVISWPQPTWWDEFVEWWGGLPHWAQFLIEAGVIIVVAAGIVAAILFLPVTITVAAIVAACIVGGGGALAIGGRAAYHLGAWGEETGQISPGWAGGLQTSGNIATGVGLVAMALPPAVMLWPTAPMWASGLSAGGIGMGIAFARTGSWQHAGIVGGVSFAAGMIGYGIAHGVGSWVGGTLGVKTTAMGYAHSAVWAAGNVAKMSLTGLVAHGAGGATACFASTFGMAYFAYGMSPADAFEASLRGAKWGGIIGGGAGAVAPWISYGVRLFGRGIAALPRVGPATRRGLVPFGVGVRGQ
ncbi:MAG: DUF6531 domain-containing protein, partial [Planctomycetota bacterium]